MPEVTPRTFPSTLEIATQKAESKVKPILAAQAPATAGEDKPKDQIANPESNSQDAKPGSPAIDPRLVQVEKQNRLLHKELQALKAQLTKPADAPAKVYTKEDFRKEFLADPTSVGLTYDDIGNLAINAPTPESQEMSALRKQVAELSEKLEGTDKKITTTQEKAYQDAVKQISREVESLTSQGDAFELIRETKNQSAVTALIEETYKEEGYVMSVEDAAKDVEDYLVEKYTTTAKLKKIQSKLIPPSEQQQTQQQQTSLEPKAPTATLTNALTSTSTGLTNKQKRERAIAAFQGRLK